MTFGGFRTDWQPIVYGLAIATIILGSVLAIVQTDVKRMLAYSSISHAGYLLVGVQAATAEGSSAVLFYLAAYSFMVIGSFGVVSLVAGVGDGATSLDDFGGLAKRRPFLAGALTLFLLGQAGVPFTSGFFAKFYVIESAVNARSYWLAVVAMLAAVIAAFLYLRIVMSMFLDEPAADTPVAMPRLAVFAIGVCAAFTLAFGVWPQPIVEMANDALPFLVTSP